MSKVWVFAGNARQAQDYLASLPWPRDDMHTVITGPGSITGARILEGDRIVYVGTWWERADAEQIGHILQINQALLGIELPYEVV